MYFPSLYSSIEELEGDGSKENDKILVYVLMYFAVVQSEGELRATADLEQRELTLTELHKAIKVVVAPFSCAR